MILLLGLQSSAAPVCGSKDFIHYFSYESLVVNGVLVVGRHLTFAFQLLSV